MFDRLTELAADLFHVPEEFEVDPNSWHGRLYRYWRGGAVFKTEGYQERFCHYWRAVLIWAPLSWLAFTRVLKIPVLMLIVVGADVAVALEVPAWLFVIAIAPPWLIIVGAGLLPMRLQKGTRRHFVKFVEPLVPLYDRALKPVGRWSKTKRFGPGLYPATITLYAGVITGTLLWPRWALDAVLLVIVFLLCLIVVMLLWALVKALFQIARDLLFWRVPRRRRPSRHTIRETTKFFVAIAVTGKSRICPPVKFRE